MLEYQGVARADRTQQIELIEDLAIGSDEPDYAFYQPPRAAVDENGRLYVADSGNRRIQSEVVTRTYCSPRQTYRTADLPR